MDACVSGVWRGAAIIGVALLALAGTASGSLPPAPAAVPVPVELFTAEGCSSCPPADKVLDLMIKSQPAAGVEIIGLGEHVDYWDRLGWKDRFSSAALTARQQAYADRFGADSVYTPQLVVDGSEGLIGSDVEAARRAIDRARTRSHGTIAMSLAGSNANAVALTVDIRSLPPTDGSDRAEIFAAVVEDDLQTDVKRGENRGRVLSHAAVVRTLTKIADAAAAPGGAGASPRESRETGPGQTARAEIALKPDWRREKLAIVAFVQERRSRRVLASARAPLRE